MAIGRVNTTSGGNGATLTVTSTGAGTVTVSNTTLNKSYSKSVTAGGSVVFKGLKTGTWAVKLSDGTHTTTKNVTITADYSVSVSYFSATISITYPAKSNCVVKNSSGTTVASNSNTGTSAKTWTATVTASGTYTVTATATDGSGKTKSTTVSITASGQTPSVALTYELVLFDNGSYAAETGGWNLTGTTLSISASTTSMDGATKNAYTKNKVDLTNYSSLRFTVTKSSKSQNGNRIVGISDSQTGSSFVAKIDEPATGEKALDIGSVTGSRYIKFYIQAWPPSNGLLATTELTVSKVWLVP